jgi:hypothetical protein
LALQLRRQGSGVLEPGVVAGSATQVAGQLVQGCEQLRMDAQARRLDDYGLGRVGDGDGGTLLNWQRDASRLAGRGLVEKQR